jgi:hypothetical protein
MQIQKLQLIKNLNWIFESAIVILQVDKCGKSRGCAQWNARRANVEHVPRQMSGCRLRDKLKAQASTHTVRERESGVRARVYLLAK